MAMPSRYFLGGFVSAAAAAAASVSIMSSSSSDSDNEPVSIAKRITTFTSSFISRRSYCESIKTDEKFISINSNTKTANAQMLVAKGSTAADFDALVIGGGVVGLAVTQALASRGVKVCMLEKENAVAAGASSGNTGLGHTGYDSPVGSLERRLLRRSIQLHQELYRSFGLSYEHVKKCGSLVVAWNDEDLAMLEKVLEENQEAGDVDAIMLDKEELHEVEPGISDQALGAVFCPREAVVEPWLVPIGYAMSARLHGAVIRTGCEATGMDFDRENNVWFVNTADTTLEQLPLARSPEGELLVPAPPPRSDKSRDIAHGLVKARVVINCAGLHGDEVEHLRGADPNFTITPRKGQFVVFEPGPDCSGPDLILERVPSLVTKGVIIFTTVYGNIVVGPTATDQEHRSDRSTDLETVQQLKAWAAKAYPSLKNAKVVGTYCGLRPSTEHRDYQITADPDRNWITVGGIRSTGLSASAGIGEYVSNLFLEKLPEHPPDDPMPGVTEAASLPVPSNVRICNPRVPSLAELAAAFKRRGDGTVEVYDGVTETVTHPISIFGMQRDQIES